MTIKTFYNILDSKINISNQEIWDKSGMIENDSEQILKNPILSLDINVDVVKFAIANDSNTIISHHPIYIDEQDLKLKKIKEIMTLIKKHKICLISLHTCFDKYEFGTNYQILNLIECDSIQKSSKSDYLFFGITKQKYHIEELLQNIKNKLNIDYLKYFPESIMKFEKKQNFKIGVVGGSGSSEAFEILKKDKCDLFITSEIKWHIWNYFNGIKNNFALIEVPHSVEKVILNFMIKEFDEINFLEYLPPVCKVI